MVEALDALRERHSVQAVYLEPAARPERYWEWRRLRREEVGRRVERALAERRPDVVVTQLHAGPAVIAAAEAAGVPSVLVLPSYESLCKHASKGNECLPRTVRGCPGALAPQESGGERWSARARQKGVARRRTDLVAPAV